MTTSPGVRLPYQWPTPELHPAVIEVVSGVRALDELYHEFREWASERTLPTTASTSWLFPTVEINAGVMPWGVVGRDGYGRLQGLILLLDEEVEGRAITSLVGTDQGNRGTLTVESPELAEEMAREIASVMLGKNDSRHLVMGPLDAQDPRVHAFASALPGAHLIEDDPIPVVRRESADAKDYMSQGMRRTLRKARNRLERDALEMSLHFTVDADEIAEALPTIEQCHRDRDHVHGRASDLDDDRARRLWQERLRRLAAIGELELATLRINGEFAAHAIGATNYPVYRVLEGRFVTEWARYAPGRLLEAAVLQRVLDDEAFTTLDWMTAVAPETLLAANDVDHMVLVHLGPSV